MLIRNTGSNLKRSFSTIANIAVGAAIALVATYAANTRADDADVSMFSLRGFGTLGAAYSSQDQADFVGAFFQPDGAGHTRSWALGVDSKLGVQMDAKFNDNLSAVLQVVSQHSYNGSYTPAIEWANLKYQFTPDFSMKIGRNVESAFMMSDTRLVGYVYPWVRPPQEVYVMFPLTNIDGISAAYKFGLSEAVNTLGAGYGHAKVKIPGGGEITGKDYFQAVDTVEFGPTMVRVSYVSVRATFQTPGFDALFDGFTQFGNAASGSGFPATGAQARALGGKYRLKDVPYSLLTVGLNYEPGNWLLMAEWMTAKGAALIADTTAWYVTGGYRFGKFTPFLTLAQVKPDRLSESGISTAGLPAPLAAGAAGLNAGLIAASNGFNGAQKKVSMGVRWDFMKNTDLKLQYDHLRTGSGSSGRLINTQAGFRSGDSADVFSLAVDFVF